MSPEKTVRIIWFALVTLLLWPCVGLPIPAELKDRASLTNIDSRVSAPRVGTRSAQQAAHAKLEQRLPGAAADFDPLLGSPKWIHAGGAFLTEANGEGGAVSPAIAKRFDKDPYKPIKAFLEEHRELFRHGAEVLDSATKTRDHTNEHGMRTVAWQQQVDGISVFDSVFVAHTTAQGELISVSSLFVPDPERAADRGTPQRAVQVRAPTLDAERALRIAASNLGEEISELTATENKPAARTFKQNFKLKPLPGEASAGLVWLALDGDTLRLCWEVELNRREFSERFRLLVDAETGAVLVRRKLTVEVSEVLYRVYTSDSPSPMSPGLPFPTNIQPPYVQPQFLAISNLNAVASPLGWINDGVMETRGNNVDSHLDRDGDDRPDLPRVQGSLDSNGRRVFDFLINTNQSPSTYSAAATVQLFYWCNFMHDQLYQLGFTETAGNFQKDNFGRGGLDNDPIIADAQDGSGVNNANFTPGRDGSSGKIQMYLFPGPIPSRDGDFDAEVVCHEYTHGLTDRMVGSGVGLDFFGHPQSGGMGEGWSDFYALALLSEFGDDLGGNYAMSGYVTYQFSGLTQNYYYGIRRYPYTTNMNRDPLTFKDIDTSTASSHPGIPRSPIITSSGNEVHRQGEIWCSMLWDMRAFLLTKYAPTNATDFTNANMRILGYITRALQFTPPNPNFAQARDAILISIRTTPGSGSDTNEAWAAFARRGLGVNAFCPDSSTTIGAIESYEMPQRPEFDVQPNQLTIISGNQGGPFSPSAITNVLLNSGASNISWAASTSVPWLSFSSTNGVLLPNVPFTNIVSLSSTPNAFAVNTYSATNFYTNITRGQVIALPISLQVNPVQNDPLRVTLSGASLIQGPPGGPFLYTPPMCQLANNGLTPIPWRAFSTANWLSISPTNGTLTDSTMLTNITITLNSNANALVSGTYFGTVSVVNTNTGTRVDKMITLRVATVDYFTELFTDFTTHAFDLSYSTLTLTLENSTNFYRACREPASFFPTDPSGGIPLVGLGDDDYRQIVLTNGRQVSLYGISSNAVYIGANGNLSFDPGTLPQFHPELVEFFGHTRVAPFYADLNPAAGGAVSYQQLDDRLVVTWRDVPEYVPDNVPATNLNNLQLEWYYDGTIRMTWLNARITNPADPIAFVGLCRGTGQPADFAQSDLSTYISCTPAATLLVPSRAPEGIDSLQGTLLLGAAPINDLIINLSSSDTNEVVVPDYVVAHPGEISIPIPIRTIFDYFPDGTQIATITATFPDSRPPATATMFIDDADTASVTVNVPSSGTEGGILFGGGTVTADVVAINPITVNLFSYNINRVTVPPFVVIQPGQSAAHFDLVLVNNDLLDGTDNVVIEASVVNWSGDFDVIRVNDNESRALVITLPGEVIEGQGTLTNAGQISFGGKPLTNVIITLQSDQTNVVTVPSVITNLAGQNSVRFNLAIADNSETNGFDIAYITARAVGFTSATGGVTVFDDERPFAPINPVPANLLTHVPRDTALSWAINPHASAATVYDVFLSTNLSTLSNSLIASVSSQSVAPRTQLAPDTTYYWRVIAKLPPFPEAPSEIWQFSTARFQFQIPPIASPQFVGEPFPFTVVASDEFGLPVTNYSGNVTLTNSAPVQSTSTIVISEIEVASVNRIEFLNVSGRPINIGGWKIALYDWQSWPAPRTLYVVPSPSISQPGELFQLRNIPPQFFPGAYPVFNTAVSTAWNNNSVNNPIAVLLLDAVNNVVDFVCAADSNPALISQPVAISSNQWSSAPVTALLDSALSYQRIGRQDLNSSNDWIFAPRSVGTNNGGLSSPFSNNVAVAFTTAPITFVGGTGTVSVTMVDEGRNATFGVTDAQGHGALSNPFDVFSHNDIALSATAPIDVLVGDPVAYQFIITNTGPSAASGVILTDVLSTNSSFLSALSSQGTCSVSNGVVTCDLGSLAASARANVTVVAQSLARTVLTNFATIIRSEPDAYVPNNSVRVLTTANFPQVSILDLTNTEPSIITNMFFNVRLSAPCTLTCSVAYATSDGTATGGLDYQPMSDVVVFPPGITNQTVAVPIFPDFLSESNETFFITLFAATNLDFGKATAIGTITDNDGSPGLSVSDVTVTEGDLGSANITFSIRLSTRSGKVVNVGFFTSNGSALAGLDYQDVYGVLFFQPGVTNIPVDVPIFGDLISEPTKTFFFNLTTPGNAFLQRAQAVATILDNDFAPITGFTFAPVNPTHIGAPLPVSVTARDGNAGVASGFHDPVTLFALQEPHTVTIGTNSATTWGLPFATSFHDARLETIYLTNEIGAAGSIAGLALDVAAAPPQILSNFTVRLKQTADSSYPSARWHDNAGWTTNFQRDLLIASTGWVTFAFSTPFAYDGQQPLIADFSYNNSSFSSDGLVRSTPITGANRSVYLRTDSAYGNPLDWSGITPPPTSIARVPNLRLIVARPAPLSLRVSGDAFINGIWSTDLLLNSASTNTILRVVDDRGRFGDSNPFAVVLLKIANFKRNSSSVNFDFATLNGRNYMVESGDILGTWNPVSPSLSGNGGTLHFTNTPPAGAQQFYRVRLLP